MKSSNKIYIENHSSLKLFVGHCVGLVIVYFSFNLKFSMFMHLYECLKFGETSLSLGLKRYNGKASVRRLESPN